VGVSWSELAVSLSRVKTVLLFLKLVVIGFPPSSRTFSLSQTVAYREIGACLPSELKTRTRVTPKGFVFSSGVQVMVTGFRCVGSAPDCGF